MESFAPPVMGNELELPESSKKFLRIAYPLSPEGQNLTERIESGAAEAQEIPTVENPRPELFAELEVGELGTDRLFGPELSDVQVTKGCRHQCSFCAAGAAREVQTMPFPAIVKIGEAKREQDAELERVFDDFFQTVERETGYPIEKVREMQVLTAKDISDDELSRVGAKVAELFASHPLYEVCKQWRPELVEEFESRFNEYGKHTWGNFEENVPLDYTQPHYGRIIPAITNYYDSDPLDYRDRSFLHEDGSPAHFGDVVEQLASPVRTLHVTTAGWSQTDTVAQAAAEKMVQLGADRFNGVRLSINPYEVRARKNLAVYVEDTKNSIRTLAPLGVTVVIFKQPNNEAWSSAAEEIMTFVESVEGATVNKAKTSLYSGPMKNDAGDADDDHHDVMACMPGYHILPDGTVSLQGRSKVNPNVAPKGARPIPTGNKLW